MVRYLRKCGTVSKSMNFANSSAQERVNWCEWGISLLKQSNLGYQNIYFNVFWEFCESDATHKKWPAWPSPSMLVCISHPFCSWIYLHMLATSASILIQIKYWIITFWQDLPKTQLSKKRAKKLISCPLFSPYVFYLFFYFAIPQI